MTVRHGQLVALNPEQLGDEVVVASGSTGQLIVGDGADFDEKGGVVLVDGVQYAYTAVTPTTVAGFDEPVALTIVSPPATDWPVETTVVVWSLDDDDVVVEYVAEVIEEGQVSGDPLPAVLEHGLIALMPQGIRPNGGTAVTFEKESGRLVIKTIDGKAPVVSGSFIDTTGMPVPGTPTIPPAASPTPTVLAGPAAAIVTWPTLADDIEAVDLYVSSSNTAPFDSTTLHTTGVSKPCFVAKMADHTTNVPTDPDVYFGLVARNAAGSAAPSAWVPGHSGVIDPANLTLLVGTLLANNVLTNALSSSEVHIGEGSWTADGFTFPDALSLTPGNAQFTGFADLLGAVFRGNVTWQGLTNYLQGALILGNGVNDPTTGPTVSSSWPQDPSDLDDGFGAYRHGMVEKIGDSTKWVTGFAAFNSSALAEVLKSNGARTDITLSSSWAAGFNMTGGLARVGTSYYLLGFDNDRGGDWYIYELNSSYTKTNEWFVFAGSVVPTDVVPTIGNDGGTNLLVAWVNSAKQLKMRTYTTAGSLSSDIALPVTGSAYNLVGIGKTAVGWSTTRLWVATQGGPQLVFNTTGTTRVTADEWARPAGTALRGVVHDGTRFRSLDDVGNIWKHSQWPGGTTPWTRTLYDSDPLGAGLAESKPSQATNVAVPRYAWPTVSVPAPPDAGDVDDPDTERLYANNVRQITLATGVLEATFDTVATSGTAAPTVSGFAGRTSTAPGNLKSDAANGSSVPHTQLKGDGSARIAKAMQAGAWNTGTFAGTGTANTRTVAVVFDPPFDATPSVVLTENIDPGSDNIWITSLSNTGFTINAYRTSGTGSFSVQWAAFARTQ